MNWKLTYDPNSATALMFARATQPCRRIPNLISGCRTRNSITANAASTAADPTSPPIVCSEPQPTPGAETTVYTSPSIPIASVTAPHTSWPLPATRRSRGTKNSPSTRAATAKGTENRNVQRQLRLVIRPPTMRPSENPLAAKVVKIEIALLRAGPSAKFVVMRENAAGAVKAAATPFTKRVAMRMDGSSTRPPSSEAAANTPSAMSRIRRRPSRSANRPPSSSRLP
jgi:hypothetical protein